MKKPKRGIAVDAWCQNNPGKGGWRGVDLETGKVLFEAKCDMTTNNIGEFLAIIHAILWKTKNGDVRTIYTDSMTALSWVKHKKCKTKLDMSALPKLSRSIKRGEALLSSQDVNIEKWLTKLWGEIPADFGRK